MSDMSGIERPVDIPASLSQVIVIVMPMDLPLLRTVPSALPGAATGLGYSHDTMTLLALTQYLRNLGYQAIASANDSALAVPLAIKADWANTAVSTADHPPIRSPGAPGQDLHRPAARARCAHPVRCQGILREPPGLCGGLPGQGHPRWSAGSAAPGPVLSARGDQVDGGCRKCFGYWAQQNTDCAICIRVCPYNRDFSTRRARWWRWLAGTRARRLALWIDKRLGHGKRLSPADWWAAR